MSVPLPLTAPRRDPARDHAEIDLVRGLVAVPSISRHEAAASAWLAGEMAALGFERTGVDPALNAVGELGTPEASRLIVLLGHIDTVPGNIPVRIEDNGSNYGVLHGRGSVDAKGPLACFVAAAARLGHDWAERHDLRVIVAGATEEETATSRGAHYLLTRLDGRSEPSPDVCIIGEPSRCHRVTLGYKGRLLIDLLARRPASHTAGPEEGVGIVAFDLWLRLEELAKRAGGSEFIRASAAESANDEHLERRPLRYGPRELRATVAGRLRGRVPRPGPGRLVQRGVRRHRRSVVFGSR